MVTQPAKKVVKKIHRVIPRAMGGDSNAPHTVTQVTEAMKARLELLSQICHNASSIKEQMPVINTINEMTRYAINASTSSLLLIDEDNKALVYKFIDCPLGKQVHKLPKIKVSGIAGLVIKNGQPIIVKDIDKDDRFLKLKYEVTGIVARSIISAPLVVKGTVIGALEAVNKLDGNEFNENDLSAITRLANSAAATIENARLNERLLYSYKNTVQKLISLADSRETSESRHSTRVAEYALIAADHLSIPEKEQQTIQYGAILHDIGLLSVPPEVLKKREALTKEEWDMIRKHPVVGYNLLRGIPSLNQVAKLILYHHERFDGKGYPCGLEGETIPMGARLISVAEAFDSMTVKHSYRAASTAEDAMKELGKFAGSQFCPVAVKAFCMGYIKSCSLVKVRARPEEPPEGAKSITNETKIWPISFNQGSILRTNPPPQPLGSDDTATVAESS
jgi:HD-GYP domain-containing protein (c-di-GMP phosphodiesterase class II)